MGPRLQISPTFSCCQAGFSHVVTGQGPGLPLPAGLGGIYLLRVSNVGPPLLAGPARALLWAQAPHCGCGLSGSVSGLGKVPGEKAVSALRCWWAGGGWADAPCKPWVSDLLLPEQEQPWEVAEALMLCAGRLPWGRRHEEEVKKRRRRESSCGCWEQAAVQDPGSGKAGKVPMGEEGHWVLAVT